jgi:DNA-binding response OmpR family regulator
MPKNHLLLVEHDARASSPIKRALEQQGWCVKEAQSADIAIDEIEADGIVAVVLDEELPGGLDGLSLAWLLRSRWPELLLVVLAKSNAAEADVPFRTRVLKRPVSPQAITSATQPALCE